MVWSGHCYLLIASLVASRLQEIYSCYCTCTCINIGLNYLTPLPLFSEHCYLHQTDQGVETEGLELDGREREGIERDGVKGFFFFFNKA
jgi:hypothetical protein